MKNKLSSFKPLMHEYEYKFIEKYLTDNDILLEWGSGNSTLYFSEIVKEIITIEHDIDWSKKIEKMIELFNINNITQYTIPAHTPNPIPCRYEQFKDYVEFPKKEKLIFNKVLIDGRARKYCAKSIWNIISDDCIIFIHDFNRSDYQMILKYYDIIEQITNGQGIVALKKKKNIITDNNYF